MAIRKNKKRIDPRYFLNETTHRDLDEEQFQKALLREAAPPEVEKLLNALRAQYKDDPAYPRPKVAKAKCDQISKAFIAKLGDQAIYYIPCVGMGEDWTLELDEY